MLGGRGPSAVALRRQEAQRIRYLDAPASRAELPESTWTSPVPWAALAFWALALICLWLLAVDMIAWAVTGKQNWFNPAAGPPDAVGWGSIVFLVAMAAVVTAVVLPLVLQRPWMRLDSTDLTHRSRGFPRMKRPTAYRWADCGPFTVVRVPGGEGGTVRVVRCTHADGPFTVDGNFGDPDDVAAILNAYRLAYGGSRGAERGGPEPSSTDLADRTWTASRRGGLAPLIVFAVCGGFMAPMFAYATGPRDAGVVLYDRRPRAHRHNPGVTAVLRCQPAVATTGFDWRHHRRCPQGVAITAAGAPLGGLRSIHQRGRFDGPMQAGPRNADAESRGLRLPGRSRGRIERLPQGLRKHRAELTPPASRRTRGGPRRT